MIKRTQQERPVLFFGTNEKDDTKAYAALMASRIPCQYVGSSTLDQSPVLVWRFREYFGSEEIASFIERWKK